MISGNHVKAIYYQRDNYKYFQQNNMDVGRSHCSGNYCLYADAN